VRGRRTRESSKREMVFFGESSKSSSKMVLFEKERNRKTKNKKGKQNKK
jgi:hypothetical protein